MAETECFIIKQASRVALIPFSVCIAMPAMEAKQREKDDSEIANVYSEEVLDASESILISFLNFGN